MNLSEPLSLAAPLVVGALGAFAGYGAVYPRSQLFGPTVYRTNSARKLALTFDDGPNPALTPKLLDLLDRYNAKATFFLIGKFVRENPALAKETYVRGHVVANHTDTHPNLLLCGRAETHTELQRCSAAIQNATWEAPRLFRPPYGFRSPWLGGIADQLDMRTVMWTLIPGDWRAKSAEWLAQRMQPIAVRAQQPEDKTPPGHHRSFGEVLCLHDGDASRPNGDRTLTLAALEYWLPRWRDLGLRFVTMAEAAEGSA